MDRRLFLLSTISLLLHRPQQLRTVIVGGKEIPFKDLKRGDKFKLYEPTGELVIDETATGNAYWSHEYRTWAVECEGLA